MCGFHFESRINSGRSLPLRMPKVSELVSFVGKSNYACRSHILVRDLRKVKFKKCSGNVMQTGQYSSQVLAFSIGILGTRVAISAFENQIVQSDRNNSWNRQLVESKCSNHSSHIAVGTVLDDFLLVEKLVDMLSH